MSEEYKREKLIQVQFGIFFSYPITRPDLLTKKASELHGECFDAAPINLPVPNEIVDFPVAQLQSSDGYWQINVSRSRADIIFKPEDNKTYHEISDEIKKIEEVIKTLSYEARDQKVEISRITNIGNFVMIKEDPVQYLQDTFLKMKTADRKEVLIRFNDPITKEDITCNNIFQYVNGVSKKMDDNSEEPAILITRDFNSDPKKKTKFTDEEIAIFFQIAKSHAFNPGIE